MIEDIVQLTFNYSAEFGLAADEIWISAALGGFGAGNDIVRLDVSTGARLSLSLPPTLLARARALSGLPPSARETLAGSCGALTAAAIWVPFECIKHRVQVAAPGCATPRAALRTTLAREGVGGLYVGFRTTLDVLDQEQQLLEARLALATSERDRYVAAHQLLATMGELTPESLGIGVR